MLSVVEYTPNQTKFIPMDGKLSTKLARLNVTQRETSNIKNYINLQHVYSTSHWHIVYCNFEAFGIQSSLSQQQQQQSAPIFFWKSLLSDFYDDGTNQKICQWNTNYLIACFVLFQFAEPKRIFSAFQSQCRKISFSTDRIKLN